MADQRGAPNRRLSYHHRIRWLTVREGGSLASFQGTFEGQNTLDPRKRMEGSLHHSNATTGSPPAKRSRGCRWRTMGQQGHMWPFWCNGG
ncbi:hypothetical protein ES332_A10G149400v1 [Gossypium tomentosum]|uniref:Uncharacterized protein n=1 Tax=Gossypium tomentosum TaxID=34277 RepID=A0A5D2NT65_GOSTO|nr:hypothetical protein ES332_A10G149400v1 [Gossypium tomentosum]TYI06306.1 hypothetical protein ES332_A10G149400v1 [Gossypium tomentosum]